MPLREEVEDRNNRDRARLLLPKAGHPASPSQGLLATFPAAALRKQARLCAENTSACVLLEHGSAPSTGFSALEFLGGRPRTTFLMRSTVESTPLQ